MTWLVEGVSILELIPEGVAVTSVLVVVVIFMKDRRASEVTHREERVQADERQATQAAESIDKMRQLGEMCHERARDQQAAFERSLAQVIEHDRDRADTVHAKVDGISRAVTTLVERSSRRDS